MSWCISESQGKEKDAPFRDSFVYRQHSAMPCFKRLHKEKALAEMVGAICMILSPQVFCVKYPKGLK